MIIDTHVHVYGFPSLQKLETEIRSMEDAIAFRTRYPELYAGTLTDDPVDISDDLITHMDSHGIDKAVVQARAGNVNNDQVAAVLENHVVLSDEVLRAVECGDRGDLANGGRMRDGL